MSVENEVIVQFIFELGEIIGRGAVELRFFDFVAGAGKCTNKCVKTPNTDRYQH